MSRASIAEKRNSGLMRFQVLPALVDAYSDPELDPAKIRF